MLLLINNSYKKVNNFPQEAINFFQLSGCCFIFTLYQFVNVKRGLCLQHHIYDPAQFPGNSYYALPGSLELFHSCVINDERYVLQSALHSQHSHDHMNHIYPQFSRSILCNMSDIPAFIRKLHKRSKSAVCGELLVCFEPVDIPD